MRINADWACHIFQLQAGSGSGPDTSQTPVDPFSPGKSRGVWEVYAAMVTGPEPEQVEEGRVLHLRHRSEPTEFPSVLHEGEDLPDEGEEAGGELHRRRSFCFRLVVLSGSRRGEQGARRHGDTQT